MPRGARACSVLLLLVLAVAGCGATDGPQDAPTEKDSSGTSTLVITFTDDTVDPLGAKLRIDAGTPLQLRIVADKPGELHVHSSPEQEIDYPAGTTEKTLTIDQPGVVDMESHTLDKLVAQLEVR